jgi:hypothetical protein
MFDLWNNSNVQIFKSGSKGTSGLDMMFNAGVTHAARLEYNFWEAIVYLTKTIFFNLELQNLRVTNLEMLPMRSLHSR